MRFLAVALLLETTLLLSCQRSGSHSAPLDGARTTTVPVNSGGERATPPASSGNAEVTRPFAARIAQTSMSRKDPDNIPVRDVPSAVRSYPGALRIALPQPTSRIGVTLEQAHHRAFLSTAHSAPDRQRIANLLFYGYGQTGGEGGLRAAASAGALYPTDVFVLVRHANDLPRGTYYYDPSRHELVFVAATQESTQTAPAISLILGASYPRSTAKYGVRGTRYAAIDVGHVLTNLLLLAAAQKLGCHSVEGFDAEALRSDLKLTAATEGVLALLDCDGSVPSDREPLAAWAALKARDLFETISARRSHRHFSGRGVASEVVSEFLSAMAESTAFVTPSRMVDLWLFVRAVTQLEPGLYRYDQQQRTLRLAQPGDLAAQLAHAALDQPMLAEAAFVVAWTVAEPLPVPRSPDDAFNVTCLQTGATGELGYLLAAAQDLGVCGVGAFYDEELGRQFGDPSREVLYLLAVGER